MRCPYPKKLYEKILGDKGVFKRKGGFKRGFYKAGGLMREETFLAHVKREAFSFKKF